MDVCRRSNERTDAQSADQVSTLELPRLDLRVILAPFVALEPQEFVRDRAQALANDLVSLEMSESLGEALGQGPHAATRHRLDVGGVEIPQVRLAGIEPAVDSIESGGQVGRDAEIGIERTRNRPILDVAPFGDPEHLRPVVVAVGDEGRESRCSPSASR